ncbi:unnamed protein product [Peronospora belbahrii]|uniref:Uncharacterized protein n=1 Tax=Peronospora belbahrii TaxID=622444 RepID=A0ABN8CQT7_9STRA|nr:unnamed protein product [Peronospora belbahrii]
MAFTGIARAKVLFGVAILGSCLARATAEYISDDAMQDGTLHSPHEKGAVKRHLKSNVAVTSKDINEVEERMPFSDLLDAESIVGKVGRRFKRDVESEEVTSKYMEMSDEHIPVMGAHNQNNVDNVVRLMEHYEKLVETYGVVKLAIMIEHYKSVKANDANALERAQFETFQRNSGYAKSFKDGITQLSSLRFSKKPLSAKANGERVSKFLHLSMAPTNEQIPVENTAVEAIEEDLQHVKDQMRACKTAMAEVKQIQDATLKLHATQRAVVSSELLFELETLQTRLETSLSKLYKPHKSLLTTADASNEVEVSDTMEIKQAKTISRQILQTQDIKTVVNGLRQLQRLMPILAEEDEKKKKTRIENKCPELKQWHSNVHTQIAAKAKLTPAMNVKNKKKRTSLLSDVGEMATRSSILSTGQLNAKFCSNEEKKKGQSAENARALLQRCSREVRTLRDKFELGAYDVNLSRLVTIVDSLWLEFEHSEVILLTTALFTLVETVEKVVNQVKRRDRLVCLESVLGVVLGCSKLHLTTRRKMMVEEYANNCRQSLEQLNRRMNSGESTGASHDTRQASTKETISVVASKHVPKAKKTATSEAWSKSHVRFG